MMKNLRVVKITWLDSATDPGWRNPLGGCGHVKIQSVGILVGKNKDGVTISSSLSSAGHYMDQLSIPRTCIKKMKEYKIK